MLSSVWCIRPKTCHSADPHLHLDSNRKQLYEHPKKTLSAWLKTATVAFALLTSGIAWSQNNTVKIIVGYPPGATSDILTRVLAEAMSKRLNQPVIVENRAGAGGQLGNLAVKAAPADGTTLLMTPVATMSIFLTVMPGSLNTIHLRTLSP